MDSPSFPRRSLRTSSHASSHLSGSAQLGGRETPRYRKVVIVIVVIGIYSLSAGVRGAYVDFLDILSAHYQIFEYSMC